MQILFVRLLGTGEQPLIDRQMAAELKGLLGPSESALFNFPDRRLQRVHWTGR